MRFPAKWLALCLVATTAVIGGVACVEDADDDARDGVLIHVSHGPDNPHRVLMALSMASMMAEDHDVLVYFDIQGVEVVLADAPDLAYAQFASSRAQIASLIEKGVPLMACPGCLQAAGKTAADLAPGIQVAERERFFSFTQGRILTLDY
jgi:predicted peroxiredoxin